MRPAYLARMAFVAALVVAAGCSNNKGKIESTTWACAAANVKNDESRVGEQRLQFGKDGHLFYTIAGKLYRGNYTLGMGSAVLFSLEEDLEGRKIHPRKIVIQGDQLRMTNADGRTMTFEKLN